MITRLALLSPVALLLLLFLPTTFLKTIFFNVPQEFFVIIGALDCRTLSGIRLAILLPRRGAKGLPHQNCGRDY